MHGYHFCKFSSKLGSIFAPFPANCCCRFHSISSWSTTCCLTSSKHSKLLLNLPAISCWKKNICQFWFFYFPMFCPLFCICGNLFRFWFGYLLVLKYMLHWSTFFIKLLRKCVLWMFHEFLVTKSFLWNMLNMTDVKVKWNVKYFTGI